MEISELRYFLKLVERENFTRAAEDLVISQSALSRAIGRLEAELGQPLFERQSRRVVLTDAGRLLLPRAEQILGLVEDTRAEINDDGQSGRLRIGVIPTIAPYFLPTLLRSFSKTFPKSTLLIYEDITERLLQRCHQGELDVAILALPLARQYLEVLTLFEEELLLVLPVDHELAKKKQITLADIEGCPFVLLDETHCLSDRIVSFCRQRSVQPVSVERTTQLTTVQELVSLGHGISLIPQMTREQDHSPTRIYRSFTGTKPTRTIAMVWNPYRFQSRLQQAFRVHARNHVAKMQNGK